MSTRLPEAMRLGITPDQLVSEADPLPSKVPSAVGATNSSTALRRGSSASAEISGQRRAGKMADEQHASAESEALKAEPQAQLLEEEYQAGIEAAAAEARAIQLDDDLLDELAEDVLGQPEVPPEDAAAAELMNTFSDIQQELDGAKGLAGASPGGRDEGSTLEDLGVSDATAAPLAGTQVEKDAGKVKSAASSELGALTAGTREAAASPKAAAPLPDRSEIAGAAASHAVSAQGDKEVTSSAPGWTLAEEDREADQFTAQHLPYKVHDGEDKAVSKTDAQPIPAVAETETETGSAAETPDTNISADQLERTIDMISESVASGSVSTSPSASPDASEEASVESIGTESASDKLSDNDEAPADTAEAVSHQSTELVEGSAEEDSAEASSLGQPESLKSQQELAALRAEVGF